MSCAAGVAAGKAKSGVSETMQYWASIFFVQSAEKPAYFAESLAGKIRAHVVAPAVQFLRGVFPFKQQRIDAQRRDESRVARKPAFPHRPLEIVEGRVRHADLADVGEFETARREIGDVPFREVFPQCRQIARLHVESERVQHGEHAAARFGNG